MVPRYEHGSTRAYPRGILLRYRAMMMPSRDEVEAHREYLREQWNDPKWFLFDLCAVVIVAVLLVLSNCVGTT
jgi:hypothetical protein